MDFEALTFFGINCSLIVQQFAGINLKYYMLNRLSCRGTAGRSYSYCDIPLRHSVLSFVLISNDYVTFKGTVSRDF